VTQQLLKSASAAKLRSNPWDALFTACLPASFFYHSEGNLREATASPTSFLPLSLLAMAAQLCLHHFTRKKHKIHHHVSIVQVQLALCRYK
jgi:hypothetical protein